MKYVRLGNSGLKVSQITLGTALTIGAELDYSNVLDIVRGAIQGGINYIDVSSNYGNAEAYIGKALEELNERDNFIVATKCGWPLGLGVFDQGLSRKNIIQSVARSLKAMNLDYIDVLYAHRYDEEVSLEEVSSTFNLLIEKGIILYWGTSEWPLDKLKNLYDLCIKMDYHLPIVDQSIFNYAVNKNQFSGRLELNTRYGIGNMGYSVLCQGLLTGKYHNGDFSKGRISKSKQINYDKTLNFYKQNKERIDFFNDLCEIEGLDNVAMAMRYAFMFVDSVVMGVSSASQLSRNLVSYEKSSELNTEIFHD